LPRFGHFDRGIEPTRSPTNFTALQFYLSSFLVAIILNGILIGTQKDEERPASMKTIPRTLASLAAIQDLKQRLEMLEESIRNHQPK
jgi:hypothetical protein